MALAEKAPRGKKPTTDENFFEKLKDWSELKHRMLSQYLAAATRILGQSNRLFYIDGFAGQGSYGTGHETTDGSPVRAAKLADEFAKSGKPYTFRCINVESNPMNFAHLQEVTEPFGELVVNLQGTFADNIGKILRLTRGAALICFLDPFGIKGLDWDAMEALIQHNRKVDFWLRFDHSTVRRQHGIGHLRTLGKIYGTEDLKSLDAQLNAPTVEERRERLITLYEARLVEAFGRARHQGYAHHYLIRSLEGRKKYHMIFATGHYRGAFLASEIVYNVEAKYQELVEQTTPVRTQVTQPSLPGLISTSEVDAPDLVELLAESIRVKCQGRKLTRDDVYIQIWDDWFGKMSGKHLTAALKYMARDGRIVDHKGSFSQTSDWFQFAD